MVIKRSSAAEIRQLVESLESPDEVRREAAIARLAIIGPRATDRLLAAYMAAERRESREAILRALEGLRDARALPAVRHALSAGGELAVAGTAVLRHLLDTSDGHAAADALDLLVALALDPSAEHRVRLAAFDALQDTSEEIRTQVAAALREPLPSTGRCAPDSATVAAVWRDALEGRLPDDPATLRSALQSHAGEAALASLQQLVELVRAREQDAVWSARRLGWRAVRGSIHHVLALRGSRVALYDLRESLEAADHPLPGSFLSALQVIGDAACLEALAGAWASGAGDETWRYQLAATFRAVARREGVSRRHAVMKRIASRWPAASAGLAARP